MAVGLKIASELKQGTCLIRALSGHLDESFDPQVLDAKGFQYLVLDMSLISHVSSFGVREWVRTVSGLRPELEGLYFVQASPRVTDQFNMVMGFDGGGSLLSFQGYYVCDICGEETSCLFDAQLDKDVFESLEAPERQCKICGHIAELDDDPSVLFEYVRSTEFSGPPASVMSVMRHTESWLDDVPGVRLTTRQSVQQHSPRFLLAGIIDSSFSKRRLTDKSGESIVLDLKAINHFDPAGFEEWRGCLYELTKNGNVYLENCPPVMLRRFVEDPSLLGNAEVKTVLFPARCNKCRRYQWFGIQPDALDIWLGSSPQCSQCAELVELSDRKADFNEFLDALKRARTQSMPPPPPPEAMATPKKKVASKQSVPDRVKETFADKYELLCKIGEGGMAEVFLVRQHGAMGFRRVSVIKKVRNHLLTDDRMIRLFLDEAKLAARIDYPNVIRVYDLGRVEGTFFMVMEYVHGRSLSQIMRTLIDQGKNVPPALAVDIVADLCKGLARAHMPDASGTILVHRDVTPNNVLVSFDGVVKLVDFGLAGHHRAKQDKDVILGNPSWLAPEIYLGQEATPQTDIWGAGLLLLAMLLGKSPFRRNNIEQTALAVVHDKIKRSWWHGPKMPRRVFNVIKRALEKDPKKRYSDALRMEKELRRVSLKLKGHVDMSTWMRKLFSHELRIENEFVRRSEAANFMDALLISKPDKVARFFRLMDKSDDSLG